MSGKEMSLKFNGEVSLGHILVAFSMVASVFTAWANIDKRVTINEHNIQLLQNNRQVDNARNSAKLDRIENKVDRLIEREMSGKND